MRLNQTTTAALLKRATCELQVEEILQAYCLAKHVSGGNTPMILRKLHLLTLYLNAVNLGHIVRDNYAAFAIVAYTVKVSQATTTPLADMTPTTSLGIEAFNLVRQRRSRPAFFRSWSSSSSSNSDLETSSGPVARSRSSTLASTVNSGGSTEQVVERETARRIAGAGAATGIGLLSAPPQYERGGVAAYVERFADVPTSSRSSSEELPLYVRA
ncbi:hypothetical protein OIV83_004482 [Microbotryomycetes sp. JL201]|nr:hypothetical protein OIV83_004482 [Microbotryomycetes sp. JL201]